MAFNREADGSSGWSGRGSRSKSENFDEIKAMMQTLVMGVHNTTAAATATTSAVAVMGEEVKREQNATAKAVATVGEDEVEVSATKKVPHIWKEFVFHRGCVNTFLPIQQNST